MDNVVKQTQLRSVWVSTVNISTNALLRSLDAFIDVVSEVVELDRPATETKATDFQYETMVFPSDGDGPTDYTELQCKRYNTLADARAGHEIIVSAWRKKEKLDRREIM